MTPAGPPRHWQRLLEGSLPADRRDEVSGDLEEVYQQLRATEGARAADRWYRKEALSFVIRFAADGVRGRIGRAWSRGAQGRKVGTDAAGSRGGWMPVSMLDFRLGMRMLVRYPGLTVVGGFAMAFAIWVGAGGFEIISQIVSPSVPLPEGERVVGIRTWNAESNVPELRVVHDVVAWREELRSIDHVGAFREVGRNFAVGTAAAEPVTIAEMSAAGFAAAGIAPLLGRALTEGDEVPGAPPVVVIGYDLWQGRLGGDPQVVGRPARIGAGEATIVGVMPPGYGFPVAHRAWMPLQLDPLRHDRLEGPSLRVFGRLADGVTMEQARAELAAVGQRAAIDHPDTHRHLRPTVVPYPRLILDVGRTESLLLGSTNVFLLMLLLLICGNVALLMFARAATRESELIVRSALGASRRRIVAQLFAEALVLGLLAVALGLGAAGAGLRWAFRIAEAEARQPLPFWFSDALSWRTIVYALLLALVGAAVAGVTPALRITRSLQTRLREGVGRGSTVRFGGVWAAVIVSQVAVTVAFPISSWLIWRDVQQVQAVRVPFATEQFLVAHLAADADAANGMPIADAYRELERRLVEEPLVEAVTYAERLPRMYHPHRLIEIDGGDAAPLDPRWPGYRVSSAGVDPRYLDAVGVDLLSGTAFRIADAETARHVVIVNQSFVRSVLGGRNPEGRRLRYAYLEEWDERRGEGEPPQPWYEIIGVVPDMATSWGSHDPKSAAIYHPVTPDAVRPLHLAVRLRGDPMAFAPRLREIAAAVDPSLRITNPLRLDTVNRGELQFYQFWLTLTLLVSVVALLLSLAGIYAVMAFTVARRTREIGVRIALGADAGRLVLAVLRRPLLQVGTGLCAGATLAGLLILTATGGEFSAQGLMYCAAYGVLMLAVCAVGCAVPVYRALNVEPTEALRSDA